MKICSRCYQDGAGEVRDAHSDVFFGSEHSYIDLCKSCFLEVYDFAQNKPEEPKGESEPVKSRRGRPKKEKS